MSESWPGGRKRVEMSVELNVPIKMRDGVTTRADVYRPKKLKKAPVILQRTPYDKAAANTAIVQLKPHRAVSRGYAVVIQDVRGRFASDGRFDPFIQEIDDGYDSVEWCASQEWSTGKVGMYGPSYIGATQWLAAASGAPHLSCIAPLITASNYYDEWFHRGGALQLQFVESWVLGAFCASELLRQGKKDQSERMQEIRDKMDDALFELLPINGVPYFKGNAEFFYDWVNHPEKDHYWKKTDLEEHYSKINVPAFNIGGWYDIFVRGTVNDFVRMKKSGKGEGREQRLLVGPWGHTPRGAPLSKLVGDVNFGHAAGYEFLDIEGMVLDWYDRWMKNDTRKGEREPPVKIFVMGDNKWRDENEWPLRRTQFAKYYMHSRGMANTLNGDGMLDETTPSNEPPDRFVYDPLDPVPTIGGGLCCDTTYTPSGPYNQNEIELRKDVLVYSTQSLKKDIEVTGPILVKLFASTSAEDTDFTAKLVDVWPCDYAQLLATGIIRARFRESRKETTFIRPERIYGYTIDLSPTSNAFKKGHKIRIEISSSNFPQFDRNMNTTKPVAEETNPVPCVQRVYHDRVHRSHVLLPVIPR